MKFSIVIALAGVMLFLISRIEAREIGFIEDFSLARDRSEVLKQLIPGTSDYYYYHCLHAQHIRDFGQVHELLDLWIKREGYTPRVKEILNRQALFEYEQNPEKSLEYIREELNLRFDHQKEKEIEAGKSDFPTRLDPEQISLSAFGKRAFSHYKNLDDIEDAGLDILPRENMVITGDRLRNLLERLQIPDMPDLARYVADDLQYEHSGGFGSHLIHHKLLKSQLDECLRLIPELGDNSAFISAYLAKLRPSDDVDLRCDLPEKEAYLDRLWNFAKKLAPAHNSLKAHVLYHILDMNRRQGNYDAGLFMEYVKLPRNVSYIAPDYREKKELRYVVADLNADFSASTLMPAVGSDDELVRDYLSHFFADAKNYKAYVKFIRDTFLNDVFTETKIVNGIGDMEQWYSQMSPSRYQALKDRIDLEFALTNKKFFKRDEPVALDLYVKNVSTLIVKVFEINSFNYYQANRQQVDTAIDLDGLRATHEQVINYDDPPLRRVRRSFDFPQIDTPGVFVLEFIGNGKNSRAVIRKGNLYALEEIGPAGHEFVIRDEMNQKCSQAVIWLAGREYTPGEDGVIIIPFTTRPTTQTMILKDKDFCSLASFRHLAESYTLNAGFYTDRQALLKRFKATVLVRPVLSLNGHPVSLSLLENVRLIIESTDQEGVASVKEVSDFELFEDKESVFEFQVPENLSTIRFTLKAKLQNISQNKKEDFSDSAEFSVNGIDSSLTVEDIFLSHADNNYVLEILGKNGEAKPGRGVNLELKHRYFRKPYHVSLQTDSSGRIQLGALEGIEWIQAKLSGGASHTWRMTKDLYRYPASIHEIAGKPFRIPYAGSVSGDTQLHYALLEKRGKTYLANHNDAIQISQGFLEISGLPAGDYDLFLKESRAKIHLRLTAGDAEDGFALSEQRILQMRDEPPLQINSVDTDDAVLKIYLANASEFSRVHVLATRFMPSSHMFSDLLYTGLPGLYQIRPVPPESQYVEGRNIGDEYRYILERQYAEKYPGNMLNRPELLLNPWSIRKTETAKDTLRGDENFRSELMSGEPARKAAPRSKSAVPETKSAFSNFDFLGQPSVMLANLKPDENGVVTVARSELGSHPQIHILAVDPFHTAYREITLPEQAMKTRELRLVQGLNSEKHFTEQKQISVIPARETVRLADMTTSDFEIYDSLDRVYQLLSTLSGNTTLQEFDFIRRWPQMEDAEKHEKYSKYACHELNFFIWHKDREFFDRVILPYLRNKKDKTFLDHWLIEDDLSPYLEMWAYDQLNIVEKILLARRGPGDEDRMRGYIKDLSDMIPPDIDEYNRRFDTALKGRALEEDALGFGEAKEELMLRESVAASEDMAMMAEMVEEKFALELDMDDSAPSPPPAPEMADRKMKARRGYIPLRKEARQKARPFFRQLDKTEEWAENNYYKLPIESQNAQLITVNAFWNDYAQSDPRQPFLSENFIYASRNFSEIMLALSVLDLPFKAEKHEPAVEGLTFTLKAGSPLIVFHKEIGEGQPSEENVPILVNQRFFRSDDRYTYVGNEQFDKFVQDEFLVYKPYGCQIVMSNPTASRQKLRLLLQIPEGAMPLKSGFYTKGIPLTLEEYSTQTFEYHFYFPETGTFPHYPAQVAKDEEFLTAAPASEFNVVTELTQIDTESWDYVSQNGTDEAVLEFLRTHNLNRLNLDKIAFRMKEKDFFDAMIRLLEERRTYHHIFWSYSIYHNEKRLIPEYLKHSPYANQCGYFIDTPLLSLDPAARKIYQHLEYKPLVNARAHRIGKERKILNNRFYDQYQRFMRYLSYRPALTGDDFMAVAYYLLLQDRVSEAIEFFGRIDPAEIQPRMQYDYLQAYLDFYTENLGRAGEIAATYQDYPVPRWRNLFQYITDQIEEAQGKLPEVLDEESREQIQSKLAATEASLDFTVESRRVTVNYRNLDACRVNYYPMDIELLFSRNPFVQQQAGHFAFIRPRETAEIQLPADETSFSFDLPEVFRNSNLMIEISGQGIKKSKAYYANSLDVQMIENYGHVKVTHQDTRKPLSKVYVKVYVRMQGGAVQFYKDGYTDIRGRFDYASLNTDELDRAEKFSVLILSEDYGAVIREALPPKR
jgi:hypothetical protein